LEGIVLFVVALSEGHFSPKEKRGGSFGVVYCALFVDEDQFFFL
jgi:hypothetical protein